MTEIIVAGIAFFIGLGIRHFWPRKQLVEFVNSTSTPVTFVLPDGRALRVLPGESGWL